MISFRALGRDLEGRARRQVRIEVNCSPPAITSDPIAISIQPVRIPVAMIDLDSVADIGTVQIRWRWRKAIAGVCGGGNRSALEVVEVPAPSWVVRSPAAPWQPPG